MSEHTHDRIVYGARCVWWDSISKVGKNARGPGEHWLPCCPHCGSVLFEFGNEKQWFSGVDRHEADGHPGYRAIVEWGRGKCFKNYAELEAAYRQGHGSVVMSQGRKSVFKYVWPLQPAAEKIAFEMPRDAEILCCREQHGNICIWARIVEGRFMESRNFILCGTGHDAPDLDWPYVGTAIFFEGSLVLHVFEIPKEAA